MSRLEALRANGNKWLPYIHVQVLTLSLPQRALHLEKEEVRAEFDFMQ
jgi:hypothetical protein